VGSAGKKVKRSERLLKKGRQNIFGGNFLEIGLRPKKGREIFFGRPLSQFLNTPLAVTDYFSSQFFVPIRSNTHG
jgi:hypothetical protein